eukprot:scaffold132315_cov14-Prasinocladus_malaysianus.AAC.1
MEDNKNSRRPLTAAERQRRKRAKQTEDQVDTYRAASAERAALARSRETPEQADTRRAAHAVYLA